MVGHPVMRKLGDVVTFRGGGTPSTERADFWKGNIPWVSPKDMKFDLISDAEDKISEAAIAGSATSLIPTGASLVVVRSGILARTVPVGLTAREVAVNQDIKALCPSAAIDSKFLFYFLKSAEPALLRKVTRGATVHRLATDDLRDLSIPVPSLAEQKRIVAILDDAFEGIARATANAERNIANARELMAGSCHALIFNVAPDAERVSLEALLGRGWILSHLDGNHGSDYPRKEEFVMQGVPYISANSIDDDAVDMGAAKYLSPERAARIRKGVAHDGDVLFAHNATVGPVAVLETSEPKVILGTSLTYYRCNPENIDNHYLAHYMRSRLFTSQYDQVMRQSTRNQVPITKQREFFHVIPPLEAQREISHRLGALEEWSRTLRRLYAEKTDRCIELRQSLLHKAFSGQLTGKEAIAA